VNGSVSVDSTELRREIRRLADSGLKTQMREANRSAAQVVVDAALPNVPVRSGRLRSTVRALASQKDGRAVAGSARVDYAAAIHWGRSVGNVWGGRKAANPLRGRPFLWDAARSARRRVFDTYEAAIGRLLDSMRSR